MHDPELGAFTRRLLEQDHPVRGGNQLLVLIALAKYASSKGVCWPAVTTLARDMGGDPSTARAAIRALERKDLLRVSGQRDGYRTNPYAIAERA